MTIDATMFWTALLCAVTCGLAYYRIAVVPEGLRSDLDGAVRAFGRAVELRFPSHSGLTEVVAKLVRRVGVRMGFGPRRLRHLETAARLRDIGLCAIPYHLVNRRKWDEWSLADTETYDCHADVGGAILETIPTLSKYADAVRHHHAAFAPTCSGGWTTPCLEARIVKACAEFVWYTRHRGQVEAMRHIEQGAGTLYDPNVARELLRIVSARLL